MCFCVFSFSNQTRLTWTFRAICWRRLNTRWKTLRNEFRFLKSRQSAPVVLDNCWRKRKQKMDFRLVRCSPLPIRSSSAKTKFCKVMFAGLNMLWFGVCCACGKLGRSGYMKFDNCTHRNAERNFLWSGFAGGIISKTLADGWLWLTAD